MKASRRSAAFILTASLFVAGGSISGADPVANYLIVETNPTKAKRDTSIYRMFRSVYDLEHPFTLLPERVTDNDPRRRPHVGDLRFSLRTATHGGYLFEGPRGNEIAVSKERIEWVRDLPVDWFSSHGPDERLRIYPIERPDFEAERTDPFTGNLFRGRFEGRYLAMEVIGPSEGVRPLLASILIDPFSEEPLADLADSKHAGKVTLIRPSPDSSIVSSVRWNPADRDPRGCFWFASEEVAEFVRVYLKFAAADYARFLVDSFFVAVVLPSLEPEIQRLNVRLPYLPPDRTVDSLLQESRDGAGPGHLPSVVYQGDPIRLRPLGLRAKRGSNVCAVVSTLKLIEARDCEKVPRPFASEENDDAAECPAYSPMSVITEWIREEYGAKGKIDKETGTLPAEVTSLVEKHGICTEASYPFLADVVSADYENLKGFARLSRRELLGGTDEGGEPAAKGPGKFVDFHPPACRSAMRTYLEWQDRVRRHDIVELVSLPEERLFAINAVWAGEQRKRFGGTVDRFRQAQRDELFLLALQLLGAGHQLVLGLELEESFNHAVFAYALDVEERAVVVMDSGEQDEKFRQRKLIPLEELKQQINLVAFLRNSLQSPVGP